MHWKGITTSPTTANFNRFPKTFLLAHILHRKQVYLRISIMEAIHFVFLVAGSNYVVCVQLWSFSTKASSTDHLLPNQLCLRTAYKRAKIIRSNHGNICFYCYIKKYKRNIFLVHALLELDKLLLACGTKFNEIQHHSFYKSLFTKKCSNNTCGGTSYIKPSIWIILQLSYHSD